MSVIEVEVEHFPRPHPVPYTSNIGGRCVLLGYSVKEATGGAAAELDLYSGRDSTASVFMPITLTAGQSAENWFGPQGILFPNGLLPVVAAGAVAGVLLLHLPE